MPSYMLLGFFSLVDGQRVTSQGPAGNLRYHNTYNTTIQTEDPNQSLDAQFRVWSANSNDLPLPDDTVVYAYARAYTPPLNSGMALVDAYYVYPFGGDPSSDDYQDSIPDLTHTLASVVGSVQSVSQPTDDDNNKRVTLATGDRLWDQARNSTVEAVFHRRNRRWETVPLPALQSNIHIFGRCIGIRADGSLIVEVESLTYNATTTPPSLTATTPSSSPLSTPPNKRRKISARKATPRLPADQIITPLTLSGSQLSLSTTSAVASAGAGTQPSSSELRLRALPTSPETSPAAGPSTPSPSPLRRMALPTSGPELAPQAPESDMSDLSDSSPEIPLATGTVRKTRARSVKDKKQEKREGKKKVSG